MAIIHQKLILTFKYVYELSSYAFSGFDNKNCGLYCLRRAKDGKKWKNTIKLEQLEGASVW